MPSGAISSRSTSLWPTVPSGHHSEPSILVLPAATGIVMSTRPPLATLVLPHQAWPPVPSTNGPAPVLLLNGNVVWPPRIMWL